MADEIQNKIQSELEKYRQIQKDISKIKSAQQKLEAQLTENNTVKEELDNQNTVYKLVGRVLIKQNLDEAKAKVAQRLEYINREITRCETLLKDLEEQAEQHLKAIASLQQELQNAQGLSFGGQ